MKKCLLTLEIIEFGESKNVELFGITIDKGLKFEKHVNEICSKTDRKLNVLSRM